MPYAYQRESSEENKAYFPSLAEMTSVAIRILQKNPNGFALLVRYTVLESGGSSSYISYFKYDVGGRRTN